MKIKTHKVFKILTVFIFALFMVFSSLMQSFLFAYAEDSTATQRIVNFDETSIKDDLSDLNIDYSLYPKDINGTQKVISFIEYCYGLDDYYGLYFYVYNPSAKKLNPSGTMRIATTFDEDGNAISFRNCNVSQVAFSSDMLFVKYKVSSTDLQNRILPAMKTYANSHNGVRRYEIRDMNLDGKTLSFNMIYEFSGQANGIGNVESQLTCYSSERLDLKTNFTNYRTGAYSGRICDELQTVYFSIPKRCFDTYGNLQQITAEWDEYKTTPIFVTSDLDVYNGLKSHLGEEVYTKDLNGDLKQKYTKGEMPWNVLWEEYNPPHDISSFYAYYNAFEGLDFLLKDGGIQSRMDWLFYRSPDEIKTADDYRVTREEIIDWAKNYEPVTSLGDFIQSSSGIEYHEYLFESSIDEDRQKLLIDYEKGATRGHIKKTINAGDKISLTLSSDKSWWDKMWSGVWYEEKAYDPIVLLDEKQLSMSTEDSFSETYLVSKQDSKNVRDFCKQALQKDEIPVLFRFANTDYYSSQARFDKAGNNYLSDVDGYVAQETVFLGFDIISLLFRSEEKDILVSVAMDPVDVFNGVEPNPNEPIGKDNDDWDWLMDLLKQIVSIGVIALLAVLFMALLGPIVFPVLGWLLKMIFKGIVFIISLPFKLIGKLFKRKRK